MYRLINDESAAELLRSRIVSHSHVYVRVTRATCDGRLEVPRARTEFARRSFFSRAVRSWNELPGDVRAAPPISVFKRCIADVFLTHLCINLHLQGCRFTEMIGRAQLRGGRRIDF